jgi:hypothetical protein
MYPPINISIIRLPICTVLHSRTSSSIALTAIIFSILRQKD